MSNYQYSIDYSRDASIDFNFGGFFISRAKYVANWVSLIHTHPFPEIFLIVGGEGFFIINQQRFKVIKNDLIIVNSNIEHTEISSMDKPLEYIVIGLQDVIVINSDSNDEPLPFMIDNIKDNSDFIQFYLKIIIEEAETKDNNYETICHNLLDNLFIKLLQKSNLKFETSKQKDINKDIAIAKQYIDYNFKENITLDDLANITFLDRCYISRTFKKQIGISPIEYLNMKRINEGKLLLETTNFSISQIATILGFSSQSYFSEVFKKIENKTPSRFRRYHTTE